MKRKDGLSPNHFQVVYMTGIPNVEDLFSVNISFCDLGFIDGNIIGALRSRDVLKYKFSVRLLRNNN